MMRRGQLGGWMQAAAALLLFVSVGALHGQAAATKQSVQPAPPMPMAPAPQMPPVKGEERDRVVAIVNGDLILDSDVDEERRFEAFQPYRTGPAFSRERTIERLINRDLILQQAKLQGGEEEITDADVDKEVAELRKNIPSCARYQCSTEAGWRKFLADNGFTEQVLHDRWKQRMQVLEFISDRFKQGIHIPDADIKNYYEKTLVPQFRNAGVEPPKLEAVSVRIQEVLLEQQVSNLLIDWLKSLRAQGQVVVLHPGEAAP